MTDYAGRGRPAPTPANSGRGAAAPAAPGLPVAAAAEAAGDGAPPARGGAPEGSSARLPPDAGACDAGGPAQMTPQMTPGHEEVVAAARGAGREPGASLRPYRYQPGVSGNPSGRPKYPPELVGAARAATAEALATVLHVMRHAKRLSTRLRAAEIVLDRGWGRAPVSVSVELAQRVDLSQVSTAEWEALALLLHNVRPALPAADRVVEVEPETEEVAPCSTESD